MNPGMTVDEPPQDAVLPDREADALLSIPETLHVEQADDAAVTIFRSDTGARIRIPRKLFELLLKFEAPQRLTMVTAGNDRIEAALEKLVRLGFLVPPGLTAHPVSPRLATDPSIRMFDCPSRSSASSGSDIAIIGVPYDFGDSQAPGSRNGPSALRELSLQLLYRTHRLTGVPLGWYDADSARAILSGISISDCGDVRIVHGEPQAATFGRASQLFEDTIGDNTLPVIIGGDPTIIHPAVRALAATRRLGVLQMKEQGRAPSARRSDFVSAGSLDENLAALPGVAFVETISVGADDTDEDYSRARVPARVGVPIFLNIDVASIQGQGSHGSAGWDYGATRDLIANLGATNPICGIGLVGLNPGQPEWPTVGMTALHLLMHAMDAAVHAKSLENIS